MIEPILLLVVVSVSGVSSSLFEGKYECHEYDGTVHKNNWHYVTITFDESSNSYVWTNKAGVHWTLYPNDKSSLSVGTDCPYYKDGHHIVRFSPNGVFGPWNEFYERKDVYVPANVTWNLQQKNVCFETKDDKFGTFTIKDEGTLNELKLVHVSGYVSCRESYDSDGHSNWGCGDKYISIAITDIQNEVLFPSGLSKIGWITLPGYTSNSPELVFHDPMYHVQVFKGKEMRIWYGEDLKAWTESDNHGKSCVDIYADVQVLPLTKTKTVCEHAKNDVMTLTCPENHEIQIVNALYGRLNSSICSTNAVTNCHADSSESVARQRCEGKKECTLNARNSMFGDPCVGVKKYLKVTYDCKITDAWKLQQKNVCFGAKGNMFGSFKIQEDGMLKSIKLVHTSGYVSCRIADGRSNWGCGAEYISLAVSDTNNVIVFPNNLSPTGWFSLPGYTSKSKELVFDNPTYHANVKKGQIFKLWYGEDLKGHTESDNHGRSCVDVYANIKVLPLTEMVCEHAKNDVITLNCPENHEIWIVDALYGRLDSSMCHPNLVTDCVADSSESIAKERCEGKRKCTLHARNSMFGDPCVGIEKYLKVTYKCKATETAMTCSDLLCSSQKDAYATCTVPSRLNIRKVSLKKQHSRKNCIRPRTFGVIGNKIWVHKGCSGTFSYCYNERNYMRNVITKQVQEYCSNKAVLCSSWNYAYATCKIPPHHSITKVSLKKQNSHTNCHRPRKKFGFIRNRIWVDKGCRGLFHYCYQVKKRSDHLQCDSSSESEYNECYVSRERKITGVLLVYDDSHVGNCTYPTKNFGIGINNDKIWVRKGCSGYFKYTFLPAKKTAKALNILKDSIQLAVPWGQDYSGKEGLLPERNLEFYCDNRDYDIISLSFADMKNNAHQYVDINLSNHCHERSPDYPDLLKCEHIGEEIKRCQQKGKKITLGLRGTSIFKQMKDATSHATIIWNMFLGGASDVRPFGDVILDGIDMYIQHGSDKQYGDFIRKLRKYITADKKRNYILNAALMDVSLVGNLATFPTEPLLMEAPQEVDQLTLVNFLKSPTGKHDWEDIIKPWFKFAERTRKLHGKGPLISVGLSDHPDSKGYITPEHLADIQDIVNHENCGGVMVWDASFDSLNQTDVHYSAYVSSIIRPPQIVVCTLGPNWRNFFGKSFGVNEIVCVVAILVACLAIFKLSLMKYKKAHKNTKVADIDKGTATIDASIEKVKMGDENVVYDSKNIKV